MEVKNWPPEPWIYPDEIDSVRNFLAVFVENYLQQHSFPEFVPKDTSFTFASERGCLHKDLIFLYSPEKQVKHVIVPSKEIIGRGAERTVRKCYDLASGFFYAKKRITPFEEAFLNSSRGQSGVPSHLGFFKKNGKIYIIETLYTCTLLQALKGQKLNTTPLRLSAMQGILQGLVALHAFKHESPCAHFDLKPENIFLDESGSTVVSDYGKANTFTSFQGAHLFYSPECYTLYKQHQGHPPPEAIEQLNRTHGQARDIWAAGILFLYIIKDPSYRGYRFLNSAFAPANSREFIPQRVAFDEKIFQEEMQLLKSSAKSGFMLKSLELIENMLNFLPEKRPVAQECLDRLTM